MCYFPRTIYTVCAHYEEGHVVNCEEQKKRNEKLQADGRFALKKKPDSCMPYPTIYLMYSFCEECAYEFRHYDNDTPKAILRYWAFKSHQGYSTSVRADQIPAKRVFSDEASSALDNPKLPRSELAALGKAWEGGEGWSSDTALMWLTKLEAARTQTLESAEWRMVICGRAAQGRAQAVQERSNPKVARDDRAKMQPRVSTPMSIYPYPHSCGSSTEPSNVAAQERARAKQEHKRAPQEQNRSLQKRFKPKAAPDARVIRAHQRDIQVFAEAMQDRERRLHERDIQKRKEAIEEQNRAIQARPRVARDGRVDMQARSTSPMSIYPYPYSRSPSPVPSNGSQEAPYKSHPSRQGKGLPPQAHPETLRTLCGEVPPAGPCKPAAGGPPRRRPAAPPQQRRDMRKKADNSAPSGSSRAPLINKGEKKYDEPNMTSHFSVSEIDPDDAAELADRRTVSPLSSLKPFSWV